MGCMVDIYGLLSQIADSCFDFMWNCYFCGLFFIFFIDFVKFYTHTHLEKQRNQHLFGYCNNLTAGEPYAE